RALLATVLGQVAALAALTVWPSPAMVWMAFPPFGVLCGGMWPIIESYVTAGLTSRRMLATVGRFCIAWSSAVPLAVALSGPLIESSWPASLFVAAFACYAVVFVMFLRLPARPAHLAHDDPARPDPEKLARYA